MGFIKKFESFKDDNSNKNSHYWTVYRKPLVIKALDDAGVKSEARKTILTFEKSITTIKKMLSRGTSYEDVITSKASDKASLALDKLNGNTGREINKDDEPEFWGEWKKYVDSYNKNKEYIEQIPYNFDLGDCLA